MGKLKSHLLAALALIAVFVGGLLGSPAVLAATVQQSGAVGVEGTIRGPAPAQAPTITVPANGQNFTKIPITVSGLCKSGLLVEIFSNGVFVGSVKCSTGSFSLQVSLFNGRNDLIARQYDALNQASPDSRKVTVTFNSGQPSSGPPVSLTTQYAKRGADPGSILTWPLTISGGIGPYAISVDWGDKTPTDLISRLVPGDFTINHTYAQAGNFSVTIKASDSKGNSAFLQLVAVANGPIQQANPGSGKSTVITRRVTVWWPFIPAFLLTIASFWLGKKHQLEIIRSRLRKGERPF